MSTNLENLARKKEFYDKQKEFTSRTLAEYEISPGTRAKFNLIKKILGARKFTKALDVGCSGNSILHFLSAPKKKFFMDIAQKPLINYTVTQSYFPIMGSITNIPFPHESFDLITALDVIEHIKDDKQAITEIIRVLKPKGILLITVPHRKKYYTYQDQLIGHYRRYDLSDLSKMFESTNLQIRRIFGVYGQLMRVQMIQASNPDKTEDSINALRTKYIKNPIFQRIWSKIVQIGSKIMEFDALYQPISRIMNIAIIYEKS